MVEPETASGSLFGSAVALSWPFLAVGAPGRSPEGAAFLYEFSAGSWIKIGSRIDPASVALSIPSFGRSIAVSHAMLLAGGSGSALLQVAQELLTTQPTLVIHALSLFLLHSHSIRAVIDYSLSVLVALSWHIHVLASPQTWLCYACHIMHKPCITSICKTGH